VEVEVEADVLVEAETGEVLADAEADGEVLVDGDVDLLVETAAEGVDVLALSEATEVGLLQPVSAITAAINRT
jgi:hypothetical protein